MQFWKNSHPISVIVEGIVTLDNNEQFLKITPPTVLTEGGIDIPVNE